MAGSVFGNILKISSWGESHGEALGVVVDGCPAGLALSEDTVQAYLNLRRPGNSPYASPRGEEDRVSILSGVFEGKTTGTPISMIIYNKSHDSEEYADISDCYRPGHADLSYDAKYGFRDYRGGGRSSGRETVARVAGGAVALEILKECGISVTAYTKSIGNISTDPEKYDIEEIYNNPFFMPDREAARKASELMENVMREKDSIGGVAECIVSGVPAGLGDPVFEKLSANLAKAICSIGGVKGFEIGEGFAVSQMKGSENNDQYGERTNHAGGILGGISNGSDIVLRAHFKPTPSIGIEQHALTRSGKEKVLEIKGRHDPLIVPRAVVVVQSMTALVIADALMLNMSAKLDNLKKIYM